MTAGAPTVGFIGLGNQGAPMARALIDAGYDTVLWARRPSSLEPFTGIARIAASPAELAATADLIGVCVTGDDDVIEVASGADGLLAGVTPATTVLIHSTVHPRTCRQLGARFSQCNAHLLDAPVSGGGEAACARRLLVMVGGDHGAFAAAAPVLSAFGDPIVYLGALGSGQLAKLLNNLLFAATMGLVHDTAAVADQLGVDSAALLELLEHASGRSYAAQVYANLHRDLDASSPRVRAIGALLRKDVAIATDVTIGTDHRELLLGAAHQLLATTAGNGSDDLRHSPPHTEFEES
jgi:3-hydroxyisobutyrate dehydrogenase